MAQTPACPTDYLWWAVTAAIGIIGYLLSNFVKSGVIKRLDSLSDDLKGFISECHKCQIEARKEFATKIEFNQLLGVRTEAHKVVNARLNSLEVSQNRIEDKLSTFHDDIANKMNRLSRTFVFRDAVISMRLDNLSDKVGVDKWTKEKENELAAELKDKLNGGLESESI